VEPGALVRATVVTGGADAKGTLTHDGNIVLRLAKLSSLDIKLTSADLPADSATAVLSDGSSVSVPLGDLVDRNKECARLKSETDRLSGAIQAQETKLGNEQFVTRAPANVVAKEREKLAAWRDQLAVLADKRARFGCPA
jgi:valyl-tRNA synthetase